MTRKDNAPPAPSQAPNLRQLRVALTSASDDQLRSIVRLVDALEHRGDFDSLIAPLRSRLGALRPLRPLRLGRLLFMPLDPLIVHPLHWRPEAPVLPRTALAPLEHEVRRQLPALIDTIRTLTDGATTDDASLVCRAGTMLWPEAARVLTAGPMPSGWIEAGLRPDCHGDLVAVVGAVLSRAPVLYALMEDLRLGTPTHMEAAIETILTGLDQVPPAAQVMIVTAILFRVPAAAEQLDRTLARINQATPAITRTVVDTAANTVVNQLETPGALESLVTHSGLDTVGAEAERLSSLLTTLEKKARTNPERQRRRELLTRLDRTCRDRFSADMTTHIVTPLQGPCSDFAAEDQLRLEAAARGLRGLESAGRPLGEGSFYARQLSDAAATIDAARRAGTLSRVRGARLMEILAGPEAAMMTLERA